MLLFCAMYDLPPKKDLKWVVTLQHVSADVGTDFPLHSARPRWSLPMNPNLSEPQGHQLPLWSQWRFNGMIIIMVVQVFNASMWLPVSVTVVSGISRSRRPSSAWQRPRHCFSTWNCFSFQVIWSSGLKDIFIEKVNCISWCVSWPQSSSYHCIPVFIC